MGYTTQYHGVISVDPPLDTPTITKLKALYDSEEGPRGYCKWVPVQDGAGIAWDGNEKFYDGPLWMKYVIDALVAPTGRTCNGRLEASGEESSDRWALIVENNEVFTQAYTLVEETTRTKVPGPKFRL